MSRKLLPAFFLLTSVVYSGAFQNPLSAQPPKSPPPLATPIAQAPTANYPVINSGDWRNVNANIPWSRPVIVQDQFDGNYLAVLDRNYKDLDTGRASIVSIWSRQSIRVFGLIAVERCAFFLACGNNVASAQGNYLEIKVGQQIFRIPGDGSGTFPVSDQLAAALASAPPGNALIRVTLNGVPHPITSAIGAGTVNSWKVVYGQS